jgi:hypothetical protein
MYWRSMGVNLTGLPIIVLLDAKSYKIGGKLVKGMLDMLGNGPYFGADGHEVMVIPPAGDNMKMKMIGNAGPGDLAQVKPDIEAIRGKMAAENGCGMGEHGKKRCPFFSGEFGDIGKVPFRRHQQMAVGIGKPVQQDHYHLVTEQEKMVPVLPFLSGWFKKATLYLFCPAKDMLHAPGGPQGFHVDRGTS